MLRPITPTVPDGTKATRTAFFVQFMDASSEKEEGWVSSLPNADLRVLIIDSNVISAVI